MCVCRAVSCRVVSCSVVGQATCAVRPCCGLTFLCTRLARKRGLGGAGKSPMRRPASARRRDLPNDLTISHGSAPTSTLAGGNSPSVPAALPAAAAARPDGAATFATEMVAGILTKTHDNHLVHKTCYGQCRCRCVVVSLCRCRCVCVCCRCHCCFRCRCRLSASVRVWLVWVLVAFFYFSRPVCASLRALRKLENNADACTKSLRSGRHHIQWATTLP